MCRVICSPSCSSTSARSIGGVATAVSCWSQGLGERRLAARVLGVGPQAAEEGGQRHVDRAAYGIGVLAEPGGDLVDREGGAEVVEVGHAFT